MTQVCVPELFLRRDKTRLEATSRIGGNGTRLMFSGPVAQENPGKIPEKFGMGRDCSVPLGKVLNVLENVFKLCFNYNFFKSNMTNKVVPLHWSQSFHFMKTTSTETDKEASMQITDLM